MYSISLMGCLYLSFLLGTEYIVFKFGLHGFYQPYMGLVWAIIALFHGDNNEIIKMGLKISFTLVIVSFLVVHSVFYIRRRQIKETDLFGSAYWAKRKELLEAKLLNQEHGTYLGAIQNTEKNLLEFIKENTTNHILACGPTGSGKGTGLVIPNLLSWPGSVVVSDIKGENFLYTSGYRKQHLGQNIFVFNPASIDKVIYKNELDEIGILWTSFVEKLVASGLAEEGGKEWIILKKDFNEMKEILTSLFPEDMTNAKFKAVLNRPKFGVSARWNPLKEIRFGIHEVKDTQNIAEIIYDPEGKEKQNHWVLASKALFTVACLHVLYVRQKKSLAGVVEFLSNPYETINQMLEVILKTDHDPSGKYGWVDSNGNPTKINPRIIYLVGEMKKKEYPEVSGIISTTLSYLSTFRDPIIEEHTNESDFMISDIIKGEKASTVYAVFPPSDIQRIMPLMRLFINLLCIRLMENSNLNMVYDDPVKESSSFINKIKQFFQKLTLGKSTMPLAKTDGENNLQVKKQNHKVLLMLDEFPALGRMENLKNAMAYMRGYNLKCFLICQSLEQLTEIYGKNTIIDHCGIKISFAANSEPTAKIVSSWAGETTVVKYSKNYSDGHSDNVSEGASEIKRALILPDEILHLDKDIGLIFMDKLKIYAKKIVYFKNPWFLEMSKIKPVYISDKLETKNEFWLIKDVVEYKEPKINYQPSKPAIEIKPVLPGSPELKAGTDKNKEIADKNKPEW